MQLDGLQAQHQFHVRQRIRMMVNQYEVRAVAADGTEGALLAFAQQKRLAFKARQRLDLGATYDVTDHAGTPIGLFRKDFTQSLFRSTWHVEQAGLPQITGQERSMPVALLRRFVDSLSWLPYHFDFTAGGQPVFSVIKQWGLRDRYVVEVPHPQIDRRLVIAMAIGLDALQGR
ncbi:LURP-one-related/scramblase family protein [Micromonospora rifamycinica]|uniref:Uncharacterized protein YxjI n=1 Tax=Micromonospora rifamycinica TaxID=291594 RepID=A0A109IQ97_9ACTN|nr:hypothetical protein [Micromonospora rifamycinica]KWV34674.1 hypothetical protein AWV63_00455 [Micromonospora rifamycinica]SCG67855.1 Uncharacterized protein YxjI [Micromonospora rifamycinica]